MCEYEHIKGSVDEPILFLMLTSAQRKASAEQAMKQSS